MKKAIFIFTKDRPETLRETLISIQTSIYPKYIIDDSITLNNQKYVFSLCEQFTSCYYLGKEEFREFVVKNGIEFPRFNFLLREVGNSEWNLGYARNFALLYSKSLHLDAALFTDDDIKVPDLKLIDNLFIEINNYQFVGANIMGLVDDSALGHIATDLGIVNERMLSGGFMVFNPNKIDHYFLNNYNEDWIWLFMQLQNRKYLQIGEVFQELSNPLANYNKKVLFQEHGEIILDGILDLFLGGSFSTLTLHTFWVRMINERREYITELSDKAKNKKDYIEILEWVKKNFLNFQAEKYREIFENYFNNHSNFISLYNSF